MFWHRLLNRHKWKTTKEEQIKPGCYEGFEAKRIRESLLREMLKKNTHGYTVVYQECEICGDRRTYEQY